MSRVIAALLAVVALLLTVQIVDRWREPRQLRAVYEASERAAAASERVVQELAALRRELAQRPLAAAAMPAAAVDAARDGRPKLGVNFLLPYDRSHFDPARVGGTWRTFNATPKGFNPLLDNSADAGAAHDLVNDTLCMRHPATPDRWSECLAESVVIGDDWRTYTFRLRPGVYWQRPVQASLPGLAWMEREVPLTSADFAFALELIRHPEVECTALKSYYEDLEAVETPDDLTLVLRWKRTVFTSLAASLGLAPLPRHIYGAQRDGSPIPAASLATVFNQHWFDELGGIVGVGAYILERNEPDRVLRLRRNPAYWGAGYHFAAIEWDAEVKLPDPQLVAFKRGQVHTHGLTPAQFKSQVLDRGEPRFAAPDPADPKAGRRGEFGWEKVVSHSYSYIGWNLRRPILADRRVRQALAHAFPKQRILDEVWLGLGRPQRGPVHIDSPYFDPDLPEFAYDPARARALLAEAGWQDSDRDGWLDRDLGQGRVPLRIVLKSHANNPTWDSALLIYRDELRALGVDLRIETYEWKEMLRILEQKDFDAVVGGWQLGDLEPDFMQLWHSSTIEQPRSSNHVGFAHPRVDELAERLRSAFTREERLPIIRELQAIIQEEQPYLFVRAGGGVFIWQNRGRPERDRWLSGVTEGLDRYHPFFNRSPLLWHFVRD